jgi:ketosteroid isomerase-like protein
MSQENVEVIRDMYEHWARGEFPADFIDPDITFTRIGAQTPDMEGEWRGFEAFSAVFADYIRPFSNLKIQAEEIIDLGDDRVLVLSRQTAEGKASGVPIDHQFGELFTLRHGKVLRYASYWNRPEAITAAGLSA